MEGATRLGTFSLLFGLVIVENLLLGIAAQASSPVVATCYYDQDSETYSLKSGVVDTTGIAWGTYYEELNITGWSRLYITSNDSAPNEQQTYCAGYVEGFLTAERIQQWLTTFKINFFNNEPMNSNLSSYMTDQLTFSRAHANLLKKADPYWRNMFYIFQQFDGLLVGVNQGLGSQTPISEMDLYALNSAGDLLTLVDVFPSSSKEQAKKQTQHKVKFQGASDDEDRLHYLECSALIKYTGKDLFVAHNTWTAFYSMYRIFKTYEIKLSTNDPSVQSNKVMFSSRPGFLQSKDDFYMMDTGLVTQETTNDVFNTKLYTEFINPQTLLTWQRVILANRMSYNASDWVQLFAKYNSGTYNNQWMVVDYKQFTPNEPIQQNTLWILEQIPGLCVWEDVSWVLNQQSYWPSFNVPYFSIVYNTSGYKGGAVGDGQGSEYLSAPRKLIFAQQQQKVEELYTMQFVMRYNDWQHDALSQGNPAYAIASRYDLRQNKPLAFGAIDAKVASYHNVQNMECDIISGPTWEGQPAFSWDPQWSSIYHVGLPEVWDFPWVHVSSNPDS